MGLTIYKGRFDVKSIDIKSCLVIDFIYPATRQFYVKQYYVILRKIIPHVVRGDLDVKIYGPTYYPWFS